MGRSRHTLCILLLTLSCGLGPPSAEAFGRRHRRADETARAGDQRIALQVRGLAREYVVHVPAGSDGRRPLPVVVMLHGGGGTASLEMEATGWTYKADDAGFLAVFPEGARPHPDRRARFAGNPQTWNDGSGRFWSGSHQIDDVGFINAVLDDLIGRFRVDERRIYVAGFSNGSSMAYRVGLELSSRIAAIAPISSSGLRVPSHPLVAPVSLISIHGTADPRNPLAGGDVEHQGQHDPRPPVEDVIRLWAGLLHCPAAPAVIRNGDGVRGISYAPCDRGSEAAFYTVEGMGHVWPGGISLLHKELVGKASNKLQGNDVIWDFFQRHPKP